MNIKLAVFNFKNELTIDQLDESNVLQKHLNVFESMSEKEIVNSLSESLTPFTYQANVKMFVESVKEEIESKPIVYDLKDLYKKVERANLGVLYRPALNTILQIMNRDNDDFIMEGVLNELGMYDWIPEVKSFLIQLNKNPYEVQNMEGNGKAYPVYTIVEKIEEGSIAYVGNSWFLINEEKIEKVTVDEYIEDQDKIRQIRLLEQVMAMGTFTEDVISLSIDEGFSVGISTKDASLYLNDEKADKETTLESLFNSPLVPYLKKDYYVLIEAVKENVKKFMELDIALRVNNPLKPYLENICFNYKENMYLYVKDNRIGNSFFKYENATDLIIDVRKELDYDVSNFFENKLSEEAKELRQLEDKEKSVELKIKDVNESIDLLKDQKELLEESEDLRTTLNNLVSFKQKLSDELNVIKENKTTARKLMIK
jgi:hypothetical protein